MLTALRIRQRARRRGRRKGGEGGNGDDDDGGRSRDDEIGQLSRRFVDAKAESAEEEAAGHVNDETRPGPSLAVHAGGLEQDEAWGEQDTSSSSSSSSSTTIEPKDEATEATEAIELDADADEAGYPGQGEPEASSGSFSAVTSDKAPEVGMQPEPASTATAVSAFAWDTAPDIGLDTGLLSSIEAMLVLAREEKRLAEEARLAVEALEMVRQQEESKRLAKLREEERFALAKARAIERQGPTLLERLEKRKKETRGRARVYVSGQGLHYAVEREELDQQGRVIGRSTLPAKDYREFPKILPIDPAQTVKESEPASGQIIPVQIDDGTGDELESQSDPEEPLPALPVLPIEPPLDPTPAPILNLNLDSSDWLASTGERSLAEHAGTRLDLNDSSETESTSSSLSDIVALDTPSLGSAKRKTLALNKDAVEHITKAFAEESLAPSMQNGQNERGQLSRDRQEGSPAVRQPLENRKSYAGASSPLRPALTPSRFSMTQMASLPPSPSPSPHFAHMQLHWQMQMQMQAQAQAQARAQAQAQAQMNLHYQMQRMHAQSRLSLLSMPPHLHMQMQMPSPETRTSPSPMPMPMPMPYIGGHPAGFPPYQDTGLVNKVDQWRRNV